MPTSFHHHWCDFKASAPGRRFQDMHQRHNGSNGMRRYLLISIGLVLAVVGVVLLAVPGPGSVVLLIGVILIARESPLVARLLDRTEVLIRPCILRLRRWWNRS